MKKGDSPDFPFVILFTDLDGTLLDHLSYEWKDAKPALSLCARLHVPVVLVSSKTRAEMDVIRGELGLSSPFISENGGGIFFPAEPGYKFPSGTIFAKDIWKWSVGVSYDFLVGALKEIREELGWNIRGFSEMSPEEISRLTGLAPGAALLSSKREYDEPFTVTGHGEADIDDLYKAAKSRGLNITSGGRFFHLQGNVDKGDAVKKIISWYQGYHGKIVSIALGDSPNDFSMLKRVDYPVLVRSPRDFSGIEKTIPGLRVTREMGPKGWNTAVLDILRNSV